jgi:hypothetical protein
LQGRDRIVDFVECAIDFDPVGAAEQDALSGGGESVAAVEFESRFDQAEVPPALFVSYSTQGSGVSTESGLLAHLKSPQPYPGWTSFATLVERFVAISEPSPSQSFVRRLQLRSEYVFDLAAIAVSAGFLLMQEWFTVAPSTPLVSFGHCACDGLS